MCFSIKYSLPIIRRSSLEAYTEIPSPADNGWAIQGSSITIKWMSIPQHPMLSLRFFTAVVKCFVEIQVVVVATKIILNAQICANVAKNNV